MRGVIAASSLAGSIVWVARSTSTNTGFAPTSRMASPVAMKVLATVTTSSPGPDAVGPQCEVERVGAVRHRAGVGRAAERRELALEEADVLALDVGGAREDARDGLVDLGADARELGLQVDDGDRSGVGHGGPILSQERVQGLVEAGGEHVGARRGERLPVREAPGNAHRQAPADLAIATSSGLSPT